MLQTQRNPIEQLLFQINLCQLELVHQPIEIIEQLETQADGVGVTVQSGTYTPTNVTATQNLSTSHAVINGSSIDYTPPTGTTRVIYEFWVFMRDLDVGLILHFGLKSWNTDKCKTYLERFNKLCRLNMDL